MPGHVAEAQALAEIPRFLEDYTGFLAVTADSDLFDEHGLDSIDIQDVIAFLEERFGWSPDRSGLSAEDFRTPRRIAKLLARAAA
jgi:acyl carrier protein